MECAWLAVGVEAEEAAHGHAQGEAAGPRVEVDLRARRRARRARGSVSSTIASTEAAMWSRWKAGSMIRRERRWNSPSIVSSPSPIRPMRSRKWPIPPDEVGGMGDGDVVVRRRPEHEDDVAVEQPQGEHGPKALVGARAAAAAVRRRNAACGPSRGASRPVGRERWPSAPRGSRAASRRRGWCPAAEEDRRAPRSNPSGPPGCTASGAGGPAPEALAY